jgi:2-dehydro-3-deoxygluconokinase
MPNKIVTFGEIMLRLTPPNYHRFVQANSFDVTFGGGEANAAVSLANYGENAYFVTKVPDNPIGQACINFIRKHGVNTDNIFRGGERLGIYYNEIGASQRPSVVVYDRSHSSIAEARPNEFDWEKIFDGGQWFHFTGITPALGDNMAEACLDAIKTAKKMNLTVSCDLNYRKKLWTTDKARKVMTGLMEYVDYSIGNEEDAEKVFGIKAGTSDVSKGELCDEGYKYVAKQLVNNFALKGAAVTLRESFSASDNGWSAIYYDGNEFYKSKRYKIHVVDRVGGGDSFAGGLIYGLCNRYPLEYAVEFAVAASCLKQTIVGDFNQITLKEVETLMKGDASGRVQR